MKKLIVIVTLDHKSKNGRERPDRLLDPSYSCDHAYSADKEVFAIQKEAV